MSLSSPTLHFLNKKTLLIGAVVVGLALGGIVLSGNLRQKPPKSTAEQGGQGVDVASVVTTQSHEPSLTPPHLTPAPRVHFVPLAQANLSPIQKQHITTQIRLLTQTGSSTGGVLTHEFKSATHAKMSYRFGRKQPLAFEMVKLNQLLPAGFVLTGREYEGVMGVAGFDGVYRLFENPSTKARLEISETYIHPDKPLTLIKELYREDMGGVPLRFEQLIDKKGQVYYHGEFAVGDRYVVMNSRGLNLPEFMWVVDGIITQIHLLSLPLSSTP